MSDRGAPATQIPAQAPIIPDAKRLATMQPAERFTALGTTSGGLPSVEADRRLEQFGPNETVQTTHKRRLSSFMAQFTHTLALLLWFAAGLAFAAGIPELGVAIIAVVLINGFFAFLQEHRAEQIVTALMAQVAVQASCIRDGQEHRIPAVQLVPGDVVRLAAGTIVPADVALVSADNLTIDLSMLTGESVPVERFSDPIASSPTARDRSTWIASRRQGRLSSPVTAAASSLRPELTPPWVMSPRWSGAWTGASRCSKSKWPVCRG